MNKNIGITVLITSVVAVLAFFGGMKYQSTQFNANTGNGQFFQADRNSQTGQGNRQFGGRTGNGGGATGEIISLDDNSVTVKLQDGSSKIINISGSTKYNKTSNASKSDLKTGEKIAVFGTTNSDGSITAQNIQLNPNTFRIGPTGAMGPGMMQRGVPTQ